MHQWTIASQSQTKAGLFWVENLGQIPKTYTQKDEVFEMVMILLTPLTQTKWEVYTEARQKREENHSIRVYELYLCKIFKLTLHSCFGFFFLCVFFFVLFGVFFSIEAL